MNTTDKPLHKDPSFWIVAVVLVGAASAAQIYYGIPWVQHRILQAQPAPRFAGAQTAGAIRQTPNLDMGKKTYSWQTPRPASRSLEEAPPQVVLIPSEYQPPSGGWLRQSAGKAIGIRLSAEFVLQSAYNWPSRSRMVLAETMPTGEFDFIANLPSGALAALQAEVKKRWGLVAERETLQTNVLILQVDHANAPGLKPGTAANPPQSRYNQDGSFQIPNVPISFLVSYLENRLQFPVLDQTGLTGSFDVQVPAISPLPPGAGGLASDQIKRLRAAFLDQLGLNLMATNAAIEMLVVKRSN